MSPQHKKLADGQWSELAFFVQMGHIGGEVERALNWRSKGNADYCRKAFERALELTDLTLESVGARFAALKELARLREALVDDFAGTNEYQSTETAWRKYFSFFTNAARKNH